jgi:hypothetical protein
LYLPSGCSLKIGGQNLLPVAAGELEFGASLNVIIKDISEKNYVVFSRIRFPCKISVYCALCDVPIIFHYSLMDVNVI